VSTLEQPWVHAWHVPLVDIRNVDNKKTGPLARPGFLLLITYQPKDAPAPVAVLSPSNAAPKLIVTLSETVRWKPSANAV